MAIDLSQFHQVFFEESFENVDIMESSLMELDPNSVDAEVINAVFRAAHSIKGGSATFGFSKISEFTHILETLLDQIRGGERGLTKTDIDLFLQSVDCLREMLALLQEGEDADTESSIRVAAQFTQLLEAGPTIESSDVLAEAGEVATGVGNESTSNEASAENTSEKEDVKTWNILFRPDAELLKTGNDPLRIIQELDTLGEMRCTTMTDKLPPLQGLDSESNYFYWQIQIATKSSKQEIEEIFEWVADESDIDISLADGTLQAPDSDTPDDTGATFWEIEFIPPENIFQVGSDPYKLLLVLADLGEIKSIEAHSKVPGFVSMDPELCYLSWSILLDAGENDESKIREVFEWVEDEATIEIKPVSGVFEGVAPSFDADQQAPSPLDVTAKVQAPAKKSTAAPSAAASQAGAGKPKAKAGSPESTSIRVGIDKVDNLINMVGELVITQSMLGQLGTDFDLERLPKLLEGLGQLEQNTRELQESVMRIRMLPISFVFSRFPRMVRDLSQALNKNIELEIVGDQTELDKTVLEKIGDPLVHLVRNAVDHGIEPIEDRIAKGKSAEGTVRLNAYHQGGNVVIEVVDDGKGLDPESLKQKAIEKGVISQQDADNLSKEQVFDLIFQPGFSTAKEISDVSGRGVGMDVVKRNIQALNGAIDIKSEINQGSTITIRLPLTLAILDGQLVRVANQTYIFPIVSIVESLQCKSELINQVAGGCSVFRLRDEYVPIIQLAKVFEIPSEDEDLEGSLMVVVESEGEKVGIVVNELLAQQQVVIKSLEHNYKRVKGVSGATILGDGTVALIVDIPGIVRLAGENYTLMQNAAEGLVAQLQNQASQHAGL